MEQNILKSAVMTEMEICYNNCLERAKSCRETSLTMQTRYWEGKADAYRHVLDFLDSEIK